MLRKGVRTRRRGASAVTGALAAMALSLVALTGCKPSIFISKDPAKLGAVYSTGVLPFEGACGVSDESGVRIRFAMTSSVQPPEPIREGSRLPGFTVRATGTDRNFTSSSVQFAALAESPTNEAVIYPAPDVACSTNADCSNGMECDLRARAQTSGDTTRVCQLKTTLGSITARPLVETRPPTQHTHDVLVLFSNGATILGSNPTGAGISNTDRQSDPNELRTSEAFYMTSRLATLANLDDDLAESVKICVGYYNERTGLSLTLLPAGADATNCFRRVDGGVVNDRSQLNPELSGLFEAVKVSQNNGPRSNYGAIMTGADILGPGSNTREKHIVLVTDGRDDGSNVNTETFEFAAARLLTNGVKLHVLQLDNPGNEALGIGSGTPSGGRIRATSGPIDHLAQLACQTNGSFQYLSRPEEFSNAYTAIANQIAGGFEMGIVVAGLDRLPAGSYRVATSMAVTLGNAVENKGVKSVDFAYSADGDNRLTVFKRGPAICNPGEPASDCLCQEGLNDCQFCAALGQGEPETCP